jgi:hypothetical protein
MRLAGLDLALQAEDVVPRLAAAIGKEGVLYDLDALPRDLRRIELASMCAFAKNVSAAASAASAGGAWGWKEPRALFHLPAFGLAFPNFKFVHIARDVRTISKTHVEGDLVLWRAWWNDRFEQEVNAARQLARDALGLRDGPRDKTPCDKTVQEAVAWRVAFSRFWAEEQLALVQAGARLGPDRYRVVRIEDAAAPADDAAGASAAMDFLAWVHGPNWAKPLAADQATLWRTTFGGHAASYRDAKPVCDLVLNAALHSTKLEQVSSEQTEGKNQVYDFLVHTGVAEAGSAGETRFVKDLGLTCADPVTRERLHIRNFRKGAILAIAAALKARCFARTDALDAAVAGQAVVQEALAALGYPAARVSAPSVYKTAPDRADTRLRNFDGATASACPATV